MIGLPLITGRTCGECTACCDAPEITSLNKPAWRRCKNLIDYNGSGCCRIYDSRPPECRDYRCLWLQGAIPGEENRPDKLGLMFEMQNLPQFTEPVLIVRELKPEAAKQKEKLLASLAKTYRIIILYYKKINLLCLLK